MMKDEARRTKEGRMTEAEGKGGSDCGLWVSFVLRANVFVIKSLTKGVGKKSPRKASFSSRKTALFEFSIYDTRENTLKTAWVSFVKSPKALENGPF
jgi:hypothetical protein